MVAVDCQLGKGIQMNFPFQAISFKQMRGPKQRVKITAGNPENDSRYRRYQPTEFSVFCFLFKDDWTV